MIRGIYFSGRGMVSEKHRLDIASNNLANAQTWGFKREVPLFASSGQMEIWRVNDSGPFFVSRAGGISPVPIGRMATGSRLEGSITDHSQGGLMQTDNPLDLAIEGPGYFVLETPAGHRYTRNGSFLLNGEGYLASSLGFRVLGEAGPLRPQTAEVSIDRSGNVMVGDEPVGRLLVVEFPDPSGLERLGDSLFIQTAASGEAFHSQSSFIIQGCLEGANVNALKEIVDIITIMRAYESNQKALQAQDETLGKAIDQVAKIY